MLATLLASFLMSALPIQSQPVVGLSTTLHRFYPQSQVEPIHLLEHDVARGERSSVQLAIRTGEDYAEVKVSADPPKGIDFRVRRVGFVPLKHLNTGNRKEDVEGFEFTPGLVPDPLFDETTCHTGPHETNAFWINVEASKDLAPGKYNIPIQVKVGDGEPIVCQIRLVVHTIKLAERVDFPVTHWFYCDALSDFYHLEPFSEKFWAILEKYIQNLVQHGNDVMHTPVFTPSTDGVKKPTQLLRISKVSGTYHFDWTLVHRFVALAKRCGIKRYEWAHFLTQWGCRNAIRIYEGNPLDEKLLWPAETSATSEIYKSFLAQFIPELTRFLDHEGIRDVSYFHISDEPHGDEALANYRVARKMMRELAPWMKFMDALSQLSFAKEGLVDMPIPILNEAPAFAKAGYPAWCYFCGGPRGEYLNRELDTPLTKIRMSGWLFYKLRARGFLHWGYNYWYQSQTRNLIDPFTEQSGAAWPGWAYGDTFVVYPGPAGPIDSIRWEVFSESLQDYALLQQVGMSPDDSSLEAIRDYAKFPKDAQWIAKQRKAILEMADNRTLK